MSDVLYNKTLGNSLLRRGRAFVTGAVVLALLCPLVPTSVAAAPDATAPRNQVNRAALTITSVRVKSRTELVLTGTATVTGTVTAAGVASTESDQADRVGVAELPAPVPATLTLRTKTGRTYSQVLQLRATTASSRITVTAGVAAPATWSAAWTSTVSSTGTVRLTAGTATTSATFTATATTIKGWRLGKAKRAGKSWQVAVSVAPAFGRTIKLQTKRGGKWRTVRKIKTKKTASATTKIRFQGKDSSWYRAARSKWRLVAPGTGVLVPKRSKPRALSVRRAYQTPKNYEQIGSVVKSMPGGGYNLTSGMNGVKVSKVQRALGMGSRWESMDGGTRSRVASFQRSRKIPATGVVDRRTWTALGLSKKSWTSLDTWTHPVTVTMASTRKDHVEAMIATVLEYRNSHYVWGGAGTPANGIDCSGMMLQGLYAAGIDPRPITTVKHSLPLYRSSKELFRANFKHVSKSQAKRGDLVFYSRSGAWSGIYHVSVYLGDGKVAEIVPSGWKIGSIHAPSVMSVVARPFP